MIRVAHHHPPADGHLPRILCVVGPTSSGKTALSMRLAQEFQGEIINADARQCYQEFSIGTGKPPGTRGLFEGHRAYLVEGIPHYLMDFLPLSTTFTVAEWRECALRAVKGIVSRGRLPIVVGGTGLYIKALVDNPSYPKVEPSQSLRSAFETKPLEELVALLLQLDPDAATEVDLKNPRRVIRALEVSTFTGKPFTAQKRMGKPVVDAFQIGIMHPRDVLHRRIDASVEGMIERGWLDEIRAAMDKGISSDEPAMTSIGYRELMRYLKGEMLLDQAIDACKTAVHQYAKRQETWFKKDARIHWVGSEEEGVKLVRRQFPV